MIICLNKHKNGEKNKRTSQHNRILKQISSGLKYLGWEVKHIYNAGIYDRRKNIYRKFTGSRGICDLQCFKSGCKPLFIEVKTADNNKLTPDQAAYLKLVNSTGHITGIVAKSFDDVEKEIK